MEDVKVQLTTQNIEYKRRLGVSFANLINSLIEIAQSSTSVEELLLNKIENKRKSK